MARTFDTPLYSSDQSLDRVLGAGLPVVLVFTDGPLSPALDQAMKSVARERAGQLLVVQLEKKDSPTAAQRYAVNQPPAVVTVKNGQVQSQAGSITVTDFERHARYLLGEGPKPGLDGQRPPAAGTSASAAGGYRAGTQPAAESAGGQPVTVTDASFEQEVMRSPVPVVVDFWAPWCGPCRMVAPILDKLARETSGRVKIAKVNVDENPLIAGQLGITGIPTMIVVRDGAIIDRWSGALSEPAMRSRLAPVLSR